MLGAKQIEQKIIHSESRCSTGKIETEYYLLQKHPRYILFRFVEQLRILSDKQLNHCNNEHPHRLINGGTNTKSKTNTAERKCHEKDDLKIPINNQVSITAPQKWGAYMSI